MTTDIDRAREALAGIPALAGHDGPIVRLGGLAHLVFQVGDHGLRVPGKGTQEVRR